MNKNTFLTSLKDKTNYSIKDCEIFLNAFFDTVKETLKKDENITFANFGVFKTRIREEHEGIDEDTGYTIMIPEKKVASFKFSKAFIDYLNDEE